VALKSWRRKGIKESPVEIARELDKAALGKKIIPGCRVVLAGLLVLIEKAS
jgi:hypothetical protein